MSKRHIDIILALVALIASTAMIVLPVGDDLNGIAYTLALGSATYLIGAFRTQPGGVDEAIKHGEVDVIEGDTEGTDDVS